MKRFVPLMVAFAVLLSLGISELYAQNTKIEGRVSQVESFGDPRGFRLAAPDPIPLADDVTLVDEAGAALTLSALSDRVFDNRDRIRVRVSLSAQEEIEKVTVLGVDAAPPTDLKPEERSFLVSYVDKAEETLHPTPVPFVEVVPTTLETRGTQIFDGDGTKISLNDLREGSLVEITGKDEITRFVAQEVRILAMVEHMSIGGVILKIERETATRGTLTFKREWDEWVDGRAPVFVDGDHVGEGAQPIIDLLRSTDEAVTAALSNQNFFDQGGWGRVDLTVGKTVYGKRWEDDEIIFQLEPDPDHAVQTQHQNDDSYRLYPAEAVVPVDENTTYYDQTQDGMGGMAVSFDELTAFMNVWVNLELAGDEILSSSVNINDRPLDVSLTLRMGWVDDTGERINFESEHVKMSPQVRFYDLSGNLIGARGFEESQWQGMGSLVAVITLDPISGLGTEARLSEFGAVAGPDQVIVGEIAGIHRGFWLNFDGTEMATHSMDGYRLPETIIRDQSGAEVPMSLLVPGTELEIVGKLVGQSELFLTEVTVLIEFTSFDITGRIQGIDRYGNRIEFEEPPAIDVDPDAEVFDHFGDPSTLNFIEELLNQYELQLRLTTGIGTDGKKMVVKVEAFRPDAEVETGPDQRVIVGGRIEPWGYPARIIPQGITEVNYGPESEIVDIDGTPLSIDELPDRAKVRVTGQSTAIPDPGPYGPKRHYLAQKIEVLGGAATEYRGTLKELVDGTLIFEDPKPLSIGPYTDLREETDYTIDFITLAGRIQSEGGLRLRIHANLNDPGTPEIWYARIMRPEEDASHLGPDEMVAFITQVDETERQLIRPPIPSIELGDATEIVDDSGEPLTVDSLVEGARLIVLAEQRNGSLIAAEIEVLEVPTFVEFTAEVDFVDAVSYSIQLQFPQFVSVAPDAEILDQTGSEIDLNGLRDQLYKFGDMAALIITQAADSPEDAPIAVKVEIVPESATTLDTGPDQFIVFIDDPGWRIGVFDRRIEPAHLPPIPLSEAAEILDIDGEVIVLVEVASGSRVRLKGQMHQGYLEAVALQVVGGQTFTGEGTIATIDVAERLIGGEPDPPLKVDPNAYIGDELGRQITLRILADFLERQPELVLALQVDFFRPEVVVSVELIDPQYQRPPGYNERLVRGSEVTVDVDNHQLVFEEPEPARVAEDAVITGEDGETLTLADLEPGQTIFVKGEIVDNVPLIKSIKVVPRIDAVELVTEVGDFDDEGLDNDVKVQVLNQDGAEIDMPVRLYIDWSPPVDSRSGHIFSNVPAGPHIVNLEMPGRPELFDDARVFISARGSAFKVSESTPKDGEAGISETTDISITFNEPLRHFGDFISIAGEIRPEPKSGGLDDFLELEDEGRTVRVRNVGLSAGTDYTLTIFAATSKSGNVLAEPYQIQFSTGNVLAQLGSLSGSVNLTGGEKFVGTVRLFDTEKQGKQAAVVPLDEEGNFKINGVFAGTYLLSAEVNAEDGRSASGLLDANNDGDPDEIDLESGKDISSLEVALTLPALPDPGQGGGNQDAVVVLDLDKRTGNQGLDSLKVLPDAEIRAAVYVKDVKDLIGYNVSLSYDTTNVSFQKVEEDGDGEANLLKMNGGLAVSVPPTVNAGTVEFATVILGPKAEQAVSGEGLLGVFNFKTKRTLTGRTEILVARIQLQSREGSDDLKPLTRGALIPTTKRFVLSLTTDVDTITADGQEAATLKAELRDASDVAITEETTVRFSISSGSGTLSQTEVTSTTGVAETQLSGDAAGTVIVEADVEGVSAQVTVVLKSKPGEEPVGEVGPIALDLNLSAGYQGVSQTTQSISADDEVTVEIVATEGALNSIAMEVVVEFDSTKLAYKSFTVGALYPDAFALPLPGSGKATMSVAMKGGTQANEDAGTVGTAVFTARQDLTEATALRLTYGSMATTAGLQTLEIGSGGAKILIGGAPAEKTPDFTGDGKVDFADFVQFAQAFGKSVGEAGYNASFDLNGDDAVNFGDFVQFAQAFGQPLSRPAGLAKPVGDLAPGVNRNANLALVTGASTEADEVEVTVRLIDAVDVSGYGLTVRYDASALEWLGSVGASPSLIAQDASAAIQLAPRLGEVSLADMFQSDASIAGDGNLVRLRFRVLDQTASGSVEIAEAMVSDGSGGINTLLGVRSTEVRALPSAYSLNPNYPNPFNPDTVVPFALPEGGEVRIAIYNMLGQEIAVLAQGAMEAGYHRAVWRGQDASGRQVASGVYFVRMAAGDFSSVRKMLLVK